MYHWEDEKGWNPAPGREKNRIDQETRDRMEQNMRGKDGEEARHMVQQDYTDKDNMGLQETNNWSLRKPGEPLHRLIGDPEFSGKETPQKNEIEKEIETGSLKPEDIDSDRSLRLLWDFNSSQSLEDIQRKRSLANSTSVESPRNEYD